MAEKPVGGTVLRDKQGNFYYVRDEVLEGFKVTDPDDIAACEQLLEEPDVEAFALNYTTQQEMSTTQLSPIGLGFSAIRVSGLGFNTAC